MIQKSRKHSCFADIALSIYNSCKWELKVGTAEMDFLVLKPAAFDETVQPALTRFIDSITPRKWSMFNALKNKIFYLYD